MSFAPSPIARVTDSLRIFRVLRTSEAFWLGLARQQMMESVSETSSKNKAARLSTASMAAKAWPSITTTVCVEGSFRSVTREVYICCSTFSWLRIMISESFLQIPAE